MRPTATEERAARADAPTVGSLRDSARARATRTARRREGVGSKWGGGQLVRLLSRTQRNRRRDVRRECQLVRRSTRVQSERARRKRKGHTLKSASVQRSGDGESVEEMARRVDLVSATRRSSGVQGGASGSLQLRGAASRSAASPTTARRAARLIERRTAQPADRRNARASAGAPLLQVQRVNSSARSGYEWGKPMGGADVELRGRLTQLWSRPATGAGRQMRKTTATRGQSAARETRRFVARRL